MPSSAAGRRHDLAAPVCVRPYPTSYQLSQTDCEKTMIASRYIQDVNAERKTTIEAVVAELAPVARDGHSVSAVAATWRFAGITDPVEVRAWIDVGVFDGHRAGMLRVAGIAPERLASVADGRQLGFAFAIGKVSLCEIIKLLDGPASSKGARDLARTTSVRVKPPADPGDD